MKRTILVLFALFTFCTENIYSQDFEVPDYDLKTAADYDKYEKDIVAAANWLIATPLNQHAGKRKDISKFIIKWVSGSPKVSVEINNTIMDFEKKNPGMLVIYMACCAKYEIENKYPKDMRAKHRAALRDMITVYKSGKGIEKDKMMEKLIKSEESGKIDAWMEENLKVG